MGIGSRHEAASARGERSREELTKIAIDCFAKYGYRGTSVDRIARAAGVTKGALYYHFRDKEALLAAAVADRIGAFLVVALAAVIYSAALFLASYSDSATDLFIYLGLVTGVGLAGASQIVVLGAVGKGVFGGASVSGFFLLVGVGIDALSASKRNLEVQPPATFGCFKKMNMLVSATLQLLDEITDIRVLVTYFQSGWYGFAWSSLFILLVSSFSCMLFAALDQPMRPTIGDRVVVTQPAHFQKGKTGAIVDSLEMASVKALNVISAKARRQVEA